MITAPLIVYGLGEQKAWGDWSFEQLPSPGDIIELTDDLDRTHSLKVRHVEHRPSAPERGINRPANSMVVADWIAEY